METFQNAPKLQKLLFVWNFLTGKSSICTFSRISRIFLTVNGPFQNADILSLKKDVICPKPDVLSPQPEVPPSKPDVLVLNTEEPSSKPYVPGPNPDLVYGFHMILLYDVHIKKNVNIPKNFKNQENKKEGTFENVGKTSIFSKTLKSEKLHV